MSDCHQVLVPGEPMQEIFHALGVTNTQVLPHPVTAALDPSEVRPQSNEWLFVGRISPEKGLVDLLRLWPSSQPLIVVGDGPDRQEAENITIQRNLSVQFLGSQDSHEVRTLMSSSRGLVFPSKALEGAPLVYGEAMQAGLPVVAADGSTLATQTSADGTGPTFTWDDSFSLTTALDFVTHNRAQLASRAVEVYTSRYRPDVWINNVTDIYRAALTTSRST